MPGNHLEELVGEWYQLQGYFVRRNIQVGRRPQGGYECELDVVAFHPVFKKSELDQIALFVFGGGANRTTLGGGRVVSIKEFMREVLEKIRTRRLNSAAIPEEYPLLRTLQFAAQYWPIGEEAEKVVPNELPPTREK